MGSRGIALVCWCVCVCVCVYVHTPVGTGAHTGVHVFRVCVCTDMHVCVHAQQQRAVLISLYSRERVRPAGCMHTEAQDRTSRPQGSLGSVVGTLGAEARVRH